MHLRFKDDIDGIYLSLDENTSPATPASVVRSVLEATHRGASDYAGWSTVITPTSE